MPNIDFTDPHEINLTLQTHVRLYKTDPAMSKEDHEKRTNELIDNIKMIDLSYLPTIIISAASNGAFEVEGIETEYTSVIASRPLQENVDSDIQDLGVVGTYFELTLVSTSASAVVPEHPAALANMFLELYNRPKKSTMDLQAHLIQKVGNTFDKLWKKTGLNVRPITQLSQFERITLNEIEDTRTGGTDYPLLMVIFTNQVYNMLGILAAMFVDRYGGADNYDIWKKSTGALVLDQTTLVPRSFSNSSLLDPNILENLFLVIQNHIIAVLMSSVEPFTGDEEAIKQVLSDLDVKCKTVKENPSEPHYSENSEAVISHYKQLAKKQVIRESDYNSFLLRMFTQDEPIYENMGRYNAALVSKDLCDAFSIFQRSPEDYDCMVQRLTPLQNIDVSPEKNGHFIDLYHTVLMNIISLASRIDIHWEMYLDRVGNLNRTS